MRRSLALTAVAVATAAVLPVTAEGQGKPPKPGADVLTLTAGPNPVLAGAPVTLTGKLTATDPAGAKIALRSDPFPFAAFGNAGTAITDATGVFSLVQRPTANTRYQARDGRTESPVVTVAVRPKVGLRLSDTTPATGQRVSFTGRVCPEHDGRKVAIQRRSAGRFKTVRRATLLDVPNSTCSKYKRAIRVSADASYRVVLGAHEDHAKGTSATRRANVS